MTRTVVSKMTAADILELLRARHGGEFLVEECKTGSSWRGADRRLDAWALRNTWSPVTAEGYEIKVSRSDFLRDVRSGKWQAYLEACHRLWFVTPARLVDPKEVPTECGLLWATAAKLTTKKMARRRRAPGALADTMIYCLMSRARPVRNMFEADGRPRVEVWRQTLIEGLGDRYIGHMVGKRLAERDEALNRRVERLTLALHACRIKRRRDEPGFDPSLADANVSTKDPREYIRRVKRVVERALKKEAP